MLFKLFWDCYKIYLP